MAQAALYHRIRTSDPKLACLRITPSLSCELLCHSLLHNASLKQILIGGGAGNKFSLQEFAQILESIHHLPLTFVDLSDMSLGDEHIPHVVALLRANASISKLEYSSNSISPGAARLLGAALCRHGSMKTLDISLCGLGDEGFAAFLDALSPEDCKLEKLGLAYNRITAVSSNRLSDFVLENTSLLHLHLRGNFIQHSVVDKAVTPSLERNLNAKTKKGARPNSALGFLSSVEPSAAPCPSLDLLSKQVETELAL